MTETASHYEVLDISEDASQKEIKRAFYKLLEKYPPEQKPNEYQRLREAYDVLSNPVSRKEYDSMADYGEEIEQLEQQAEDILHSKDPDYDAAIRILKKAIVLGPEIGTLRNMLGECFLQKEQHNKAAKQFEKALDIDPENERYQLNRGIALHRLDRLSEAEKILRKAWSQNEDDYAPPRALAQVLFSDGRTDEALSVLDDAIYADDQVDFQDFFCIYDKLQLLLVQGEQDKLEDHLNVVDRIAEREEDRHFAGFMLARLAEELYQAKVFRLADKFASTAKTLNPDSQLIEELAGSASDLKKVEESVKEILEAEWPHGLVKNLIGNIYGAYVGFEDEQGQGEQQFQEIMSALDKMIQTEPDCWEIQDTLETIRDSYPEVYNMNPDLFDNILSIDITVSHVSKPCPYCDENVTSGVWETGKGQCPHCKRQIKIGSHSYSKDRNWGCIIFAGIAILTWLILLAGG